MTKLFTFLTATAMATGMAFATGVALPYTQDFSAPDALDGLTVINANNDNREWVLKDGHAWLQYEQTNPSDDWLVLPGIQMSANKAYVVKFDAWAHQGNYFPERFEVKYGNAPEASALTVTVLEPTVLTNKEDEPVHFECAITPAVDGVYYIGFHGISDADQDGLFLDNIEVSEKSLSVPAEPTDFTVTPDPMGSNSTVITFKAPLIDMAGNTLTALSKIEILRGDDVIHTVDNPAPGATVTYTDNGASRGLTQYKAVAYTSDGRGREVFTTVFVGVNTPAPVPSVTVSESSSKPGQVTLTWEVPATDIDGNPINTDLITYEVVERNGIYSQTVIKSGIKGTSYTYQAVPAGDPQQFKQWGVYSYTDNGTLHDTRTGLKAIGQPYAAPYAESFANGEAATITDNKIEGIETGWTGHTDEERLGVKAQDGDNGFSGLVTENNEDGAILTLGKVSLAGVQNPALSFYLFNPSSQAAGAVLDIFEVQICVNNEWQTLANFTLESLAKQNAWNRLTYPLDDYAGQTVQFRFLGLVVNGGLILVDNIRIGEQYASNIGATGISLPLQVKPNTDFTVGVTVENYGTTDFDGYTVALSRNGERIATLPGTAVAVNDEATVTFTDRLNPAMDDIVYYTATIISDNDQNAADNDSRRGTVRLVRSSLPAPEMLTTQVSDDNVTLEWQTPDMSAVIATTVTESFELAESWAIDNVEGWTFHDVDNFETYGIGSYTYPGRNAKMAFQVFDANSDPFATETGFDANTGSKYLASFASKSLKNDDWAISPRLSGEAQTISFAASSFNLGGTGYQYLESFEVLYSTTGTETADFTKIAEVPEVPEAWTQYSYNLPEGALYFAIRCTSENKYVFMVDDVTYAPAKALDETSFGGYNIYRNSVKVNDAPVSALTYTDTRVPKGDHTYVVTAIFGNEESDISNLATATVTYGGLDGVNGDNGITVSAQGNTIVVTGNADATVYALDGRTVATIPAADRATATVAPGIYIVKAGDTVARIAVR